MDPRTAYDWLAEHSRTSNYLASMGALLYWDQRTGIPPKGSAHRNEQLAVLARLLHQRGTDPARGEALANAEAGDLAADPLSPEAVNLREWRRCFDRTVKIPERLAVAMARAVAEAENAWEAARPANDWAAFMPHLEKVLGLKREEAEAVGYADEPYDALLDEYEPGETAKELEPVFARLRDAASGLVARLAQAPRQPDPGILGRGFDKARQEAFLRRAIAAIGFDFEGGRLDVSAHPFSTTIGPGDQRITTRFSDTRFADAFFGSVHEAGHSMYEAGLPPEHWGTPLGGAVSLGVHESQSRMWENMVARSAGFWLHFFGPAREAFPELADVGFDDFLLAVNEVRPSLIRVEADEVTYNLHVLLRFELELALMRGDLAVADLPGAWSEKMRTYLGIEPDCVGNGCMQDVHWSAGLIGYFPTYTLGNLYAAQFFAKAEADLGDLASMFARGEFAPLLGWLRTHIHSQGSRLWPRDLVRTVTGEGLNPACLIAYQERKYGELYGL
ncbi:MAG: carboxypeptidase M32 [Desulfovibrionaceae bacterium]